MKTSVDAKNATTDYILTTSILLINLGLCNLHRPRNITTFVLIIYGTKQPMTTETPILNDHNKTEYPPMHNGEFNTSPIAIYTSEDNVVSLDVKLENETVWLSRSQLSILFDRDKTIGKHINNALKEELKGLPVVAKFATTAFKSQSLH